MHMLCKKSGDTTAAPWVGRATCMAWKHHAILHPIINKMVAQVLFATEHVVSFYVLPTSYSGKELIRSRLQYGPAGSGIYPQWK